MSRPDGARICLVGKYPPVQGGVSAQTHLAAEVLAARGHRVDVVTNAREVEPGFRQLLSEDDERQLGGTPTDMIGVHNTRELATDAYLPWANPYVTKLVGLTLSVLEDADCDAVVGWYLEPYGLAAALAAQIKGLPLMLIHAGSDIGRLAEHPDLAEAYRWCIASADRIQTDPRTILRLSALGARPEQLVFPDGSRIADRFAPEAAPLNLEAYWPLAVDRYRELADRGGPALPSPQRTEPDRDAPTVGVYGKVADAKGSFDLLAALRRMADEGVRFNLLAAVGGHSEDHERFLEGVWSQPLLRERSIVLPFIAPWRIPELLARCDVACCLERRFPISFHTSRVPLEIAMSGTCAVCSQEVIAPHAGEGAFVDGDTCVVVGDPEDHDELASALRRAIEDPAEAAAIAARARARELEFQEPELPESSIAGAIDAWMGARVGGRA